MRQAVMLPRQKVMSVLQAVIAFFGSGKTRQAPVKTVKSAEIIEKPVTKLDTATGLMVEKYFRHGRLHRMDDQPAVIEYDPATKRVIREQYFKNGSLHRDGGKAAYIEYSATTGRVVLEVFFRDGCLYQNGDEPTAIDYDRETGERIIYDRSRPGSPPIKP